MKVICPKTPGQREKILDTVRSKDGMYEYSSSQRIRGKMVS